MGIALHDPSDCPPFGNHWPTVTGYIWRTGPGFERSWVQYGAMIIAPHSPRILSPLTVLSKLAAHLRPCESDPKH